MGMADRRHRTAAHFTTDLNFIGIYQDRLPLQTLRHP